VVENTVGTAERGMRKSFDGVVISDKMQKTITVVVERLEIHPKYKKYIRRKTKLKAHDEKGDARIGDLVRITETRPLSKTKRWRLVQILRKAQ
jgi:small subunit ribosomal protein S17